MNIDPHKCVACGNCLPICPMGAIHVDPASSRATIDEDECVECFACFRGMSKEHLNPVMVRTIRAIAKFFRFRFDPEPDICPTDAIVPQELAWPRIVRRAFSDPQVPHESTGIHGRGTAEVKTNDVTNRVKNGEAGFVIEFGRPGVGARFRDIQQVTQALAELKVEFEKNNPVASLMSDSSRGLIREDILNEKILSAIVEIKARLEEVPGVLRKLRELSQESETVVSVGVSTRCDADGHDPLREILKREGYPTYRGKTNLGLGRVTRISPHPSLSPVGGEDKREGA
ncbi:MAG: 4Fe-4S binding protein [Deltaproteobacteria bacterium]|nr:4Fe-4S binding protein [Deltaproteobacteria bacterium]